MGQFSRLKEVIPKEGKRRADTIAIVIAFF